MVRRRVFGRTVGVCTVALSLASVVGCGDDSAGQDGSATEGTETDGSAGPTSDTEGATESETDGTGETGEPPVEVHPPPGGLRRLLSHQYLSSVEYLLGAEAAAVASAPGDPRIGTFDAMGTLDSVPSPADVELYESSALAVAAAAVQNPTRLAQWAPCVQDGPADETCYEQIATQLGRLAWRRPLTDLQVDRLIEVAVAARDWDGGSFETGATYLVSAILQSPRFLYLVEVGTPTGDGAPRELDGYELAARMSFFLLGRTPDAVVIDQAEAGELGSDEGVRDLAWAMLEQPEARDTITRFYGEFLTVRNIASKGKDDALFPMFSDELKGSMLAETMLLVEDVVFEQDQSILRLFDADYTFVDDELAAIYGVAPPGPGQWVQTSLPPAQNRAGVLTHASWLSMLSHTDVNSPTRRGLFVMEQLLCEEIPLPPPRVNPEPQVPDPDQTLREKLIQHMEDPACSGCHQIIDPVGFAFENFDPVGRFRTEENGKPIDATGEVSGLGSFDGAAEIIALLVADERLGRCLTDKVYTGGLGFVPEEDMAPTMDEVAWVFADADHNMKQLLVELTASPVFRLVDEPK